MLDDGEKVVADRGYQDEWCEIPSDTLAATSKIQATMRARRETLNKRLKQLFSVSHKFRHNISRHFDCFHAVRNLTQLMIESGEPLFNL